LTACPAFLDIGSASNTGKQFEAASHAQSIGGLAKVEVSWAMICGAFSYRVSITRLLLFQGSGGHISMLFFDNFALK
jgi:hypothetical protein